MGRSVHKMRQKKNTAVPDASSSKRADPGVPLAIRKHLQGKKQIIRAELSEAHAKQQYEEKMRARNMAKEADADLPATFTSLAQSVSNEISFASDMLGDLASPEAGGSQVEDLSLATRDSSIKAYMRELRKVIDLSDVLLMVLDARDPMGCRSTVVEKELLRREAEGKRLVFVLNKIDLVPRENIEKWLLFLRRSYPTIPFKSSTQNQRNNLSSRSVPTAKGTTNLPSSSKMGAECLGADALINLLKNYSRSSTSMKGSITAGVIGFPNVGKSSVVNSLKRSRACGVGAMPGFTKVAQEVVLDKNIKMLDSPGVVFADDIPTDGHEDVEAIKRRRAEALLRNVVKVEIVEDPIMPVDLILSRCNQEHLLTLYAIPPFTDVTDFLVKLALTRGRLGKGGVPDLIGTARQVLRDYNTGKIPYYTLPPVIAASDIKSLAAAPVEDATIITSQMAPAFDLGGLFKAADGEALDFAGTAMIKITKLDEEINSSAHEISKNSIMDKSFKPFISSEDTDFGHNSLPPRMKIHSSAPATIDLTIGVDSLSKNNQMSRAALKKKAKLEAKLRRRQGLLPMNGVGGEGELMKSMNGMEVETQMDLDKDREEESEPIFDHSRSATAGVFAMFGLSTPITPKGAMESDEDL